MLGIVFLVANVHLCTSNNDLQLSITSTETG
jgi:hypothetical protein